MYSKAIQEREASILEGTSSISNINEIANTKHTRILRNQIISKHNIQKYLSPNLPLINTYTRYTNPAHLQTPRASPNNPRTPTVRTFRYLNNFHSFNHDHSFHYYNGGNHPWQTVLLLFLLRLSVIIFTHISKNISQRHACNPKHTQ